jgi:hypothetical protein
VIYRPETDLASHYYRPSLLNNDEYIWFGGSKAIKPFD